MLSHNPITMIKADHDKVENLYKRYQTRAGEVAEQRAIAEQICHELEIHAKIEEDIFYPALQAKLGKDAKNLVEEAVREHNEMKRLISQLQTGGFDSDDFDNTVHTLMRGVMHHVQEEENEMLPQAEQHLGHDLEQLGVKMEQRKQALQASTATARKPGSGSLAQQKTPTDKNSADTSTIEESIDVHVPVQVAYNQWTQFEAFPHFMEGIERVTQLDDRHLHWQAKIGGSVKEWDAVITEQIPDQRIAWTNTTGARNAGVVTFHYLAEGHTRVMLQLEYEPEGVMENLGDMLGVVSSRVRGDLQRFKEFIESRGAETGAWRGTVEHSRS